jgi:hypothetical protein
LTIKKDAEERFPTGHFLKIPTPGARVGTKDAMVVVVVVVSDKLSRESPSTSAERLCCISFFDSDVFPLNYFRFPISNTPTYQDE